MCDCEGDLERAERFAQIVVRQKSEIERLRAALREIATHSQDYTACMLAMSALGLTGQMALLTTTRAMPKQPTDASEQ